MKIVLRAFENKLSGVMEIPEDTGPRFRLAMTQPIQVYKADYKHEYPMMSAGLNKIANFEWTGSTFSQKDHAWDGAREYQLTSFD
jgi:hypothetical protein